MKSYLTFLPWQLPPLASVPVPMLPMLFRQNKSRPMHVVPWGPM